jgi:Fe-S cluster biogenesis protein NfuA
LAEVDVRRLVAVVAMLVVVAACSREPDGDRAQTRAVAADVEQVLAEFFEVELINDSQGGCGDGSGRVRLIWQYDSAGYVPTESEYSGAVERLSAFVESEGGSVRIDGAEQGGDVKVFAEIGTTGVSMYRRRSDQTVYVEFAGGCVDRSSS